MNRMPSRPLWHRAPLQYVKLPTSGGTMEPFCCYLTRNSPAFSIFGENMFALNAITLQYLNDVKVRSLFLCFAIPRLEKARCPDQKQRTRKDTNHCWLDSRVCNLLLTKLWQSAWSFDSMLPPILCNNLIWAAAQDGKRPATFSYLTHLPAC